jgi:uncharacterized protein YegL
MFAVLSIVPGVVRGQAGVSSASASRARSESENQPLPSPSPAPRRFFSVAPPFPAAPDNIAVEEIINYHRHRLPLPKSGEGIALDVRWGNDRISDGNPSVMQVGLATAEFDDTSDLRPLNLALVIDHSGSMAAADKMVRVKDALQTLVDKLRPRDIVSVVVFDGTAQVLLPASTIGNGGQLRRVIESIRPAGSTNINAGLMLGYREAAKNLRPNYTNRVILLTDGIANAGETDPRRIADNSADFNERGIDLSTIGVGEDLDNNLLRTLAKRGHGLYHFVADSRDIEKVFVSEVQSLMSPVARDVHVEITADASLRLVHLYGYEPHFSGNHIALDLDDLNNGATEVIMVQYAPKGVGSVTVHLTYFDIKKQRTVELSQKASLGYGNGRNFLEDPEVRKNYTIATIAQALSDMQKSWRRNDYRSAETIVRAAVSETHERYPRMEDSDIRTQLEVAENYLSTLQRFD